MHLWDPTRGARCNCRCHGVVIVDPESPGAAFNAYLNSPPRYDSSFAWAEACRKCEFEHWVAAGVHDHVTAMEADERENLNIYYITHPRRVYE